MSQGKWQSPCTSPSFRGTGAGKGTPGCLIYPVPGQGAPLHPPTRPASSPAAAGAWLRVQALTWAPAASSSASALIDGAAETRSQQGEIPALTAAGALSEMPQTWAFCGNRGARNAGTGAGMRSPHQTAPYRGAAPRRESRGRKTKRAVSRQTGERWHRDVPAQGTRDVTLALPWGRGVALYGEPPPPVTSWGQGTPGGPQLGQGTRGQAAQLRAPVSSHPHKMSSWKPGCGYGASRPWGGLGDARASRIEVSEERGGRKRRIRGSTPNPL